MRDTETVYQLLTYVSKVKNISKSEAAKYLQDCDFKCLEIEEFKSLTTKH